MADELAEIDGFKPNVTLVDGEETEVKSKTRQVRIYHYFIEKEPTFPPVKVFIKSRGHLITTTGVYSLNSY